MAEEIFAKQKLACQSKVDLSRKGAVDQPIVALVAFINGLPDYFTTSSCSGRICVFEENHESKARKKGCHWLFTSHDICDWRDVEASLKYSVGDACIKFEPFVLHVQCRTLLNARTLHAAAAASGFRNSGITVGKCGKIVAAVRSTHGLEAPFTHHGARLVSAEYIEYTVGLACSKMTENSRRINLFFASLQKAVQESASETKEPLSTGGQDVDTTTSTRRRKHGRRTVNTSQANRANDSGVRTKPVLADDSDKEDLTDSLNCLDVLSIFDE